MSHMEQCRKTHDRCDCPMLEARECAIEDMADLRAQLAAAEKERDEARVVMAKAREELESHMCADDKDLDGCMACEALNILVEARR